MHAQVEERHEDCGLGRLFRQRQVVLSEKVSLGVGRSGKDAWNPIKEGWQGGESAAAGVELPIRPREGMPPRDDGVAHERNVGPPIAQFF
jgi:hypothetical protein